MSFEREKHVNIFGFVKSLGAYTVEEMAAAIEGTAVSLAPVGDTGNLKGSMYRKRKSEDEYEVGNTADYAVYQEMGTSRMSAQPFLIPALDEKRKQLRRIAAKMSKRAFNDNKR